MINSEDFSKVVQKKCDYYIPKFEDMKESKKEASWNFAGFFFSFSWLVYRKMYVEGFIALGIRTLVMFIDQYERTGSWMIRLACGIYGNYLYFKHCERKINNTMNLEEDLKNNKLHRAGGVSIIGLLGVFIVIFIATGIYVKYNPSPF